jgi:hypothetical protein
MKAGFLAAFCLLTLAGQAHAGWYHVENFEGTIGEKPVHISIQKYDGFGSGIAVEGSYFYDAKRTPIPIYGKVVGDTLQLCEILNEEQFQKTLIVGSKTAVDTASCPLSLSVSATGVSGTFKEGDITHPVELRKTASLDDTADGIVEGVVEIPFWAQTDAYMFSGLYEKTELGICMTRLRVIEKTGGKVHQEIRFGDDQCDAGMVMTPIYMNVEKFTDGGRDTIAVNFRDGGMGYSQTYKLDR